MIPGIDDHLTKFQRLCIVKVSFDPQIKAVILIYVSLSSWMHDTLLMPCKDRGETISMREKG